MTLSLKTREIRVEINLPLKVTKICYRDETVINLNKVLPIKVVNLSASGVLIFSVLDLPKDIKLYLNLPINREIVPCIAEIVRKESKKDGFFYGCKMFFISEIENSKIRKYIFSKQIDNLREKGVLYV